MGLAAKYYLDQPKYKTWQHGRKPEAEGKGDSPRSPQINCEDMRMLSARTGDKLRAISEVARKGKRVKDLRRLMNHPDLWMQAYLNIQGNKGALTRGTDSTTMDGFSPERAANLVELIRERRYKPKPVRRHSIPTKIAGKMRPLGIPSADDKLVQEVVRMILERIYEPLFKDSSHGFRPKRSCHTALKSMQKGWTGTKWLVDIDIKGYFNNINHEILMELLKKTIEDTQFLNLIRDMLKAGYVEDWQYHETYSGTPQGGIVSPILANIYLHELDEFMGKKKQEFDHGKGRKPSTEWDKVTWYLRSYRKRIEALKGDMDPLASIRLEGYKLKLRELSERQKRLPASDPLDVNYRRLFYVRYADDYLIGIIGNKQEAETIFREIKNFLNTSLKLEISEEKSGIHHAKEGAAFLGYVVQNFSSEKVVKIHRKDTKVVATRRTVKERLQLRIPQRKMSEFCQRKGYGNYEDLQLSARPGWIQVDDEEILLAFNAEMRGIANYYALANGAKGGLKRLMYLAKSSFLATLAQKHQSSISKENARLRQGKDITILVKTKEGKPKRYALFTLRNWKPPQPKESKDVDKMPITAHLRFGRSSLEQRLNASVCESCGKEGGYFEVHHVRKLKDLQGKQWWEQVMSARKRKTLILCNECHILLHAGKLSKRQKEF
jgi:group II intron reverse transcriptase/maturase